MNYTNSFPVIQRHPFISLKVILLITVMHCAGFFLMKISFHITAGAVWLDALQHQPVNWGQPAREPRGDRVHCEQTSQSLPIHKTGGSWVRSHDELMATGGQVSEHWHLKWRISFVTITKMQWMRISPFHSQVFPSVQQEMCCTVFQSGGSGNGRQPVSVFPVVSLKGHEIGQQAAPQSHSRAFLPLTGEEELQLKDYNSDWAEISPAGDLHDNNVPLKTMTAPLVKGWNYLLLQYWLTMWHGNFSHYIF